MSDGIRPRRPTEKPTGYHKAALWVLIAVFALILIVVYGEPV